MALLSVFAAVVDVGWRLVGGERPGCAWATRASLGAWDGWRGATANDEGLRDPRQGTQQLNNLTGMQKNVGK